MDYKARRAVQSQIVEKCQITLHGTRRAVKYALSTGDEIRDDRLKTKFVCAKAFGNVFGFSRKQRQSLLNKRKNKNKGYVLSAALLLLLLC